MITTPLRAANVELDSTTRLTVPGPVPPFPPTMAIHALVLLTVQLHSAAVVTVTESEPPAGSKEMLFFEIAYSQFGGTATLSVAVALVAEPNGLLTMAK